MPIYSTSQYVDVKYALVHRTHVGFSDDPFAGSGAQLGLADDLSMRARPGPGDGPEFWAYPSPTSSPSRKVWSYAGGPIQSTADVMQPAGPPTVYNRKSGPGSGVKGLFGLMVSAKSPTWATWPSASADAASLFQPLAPRPTGPMTSGKSKKAWDEWLHAYAAQEEAANALLFQAHIANRWDLLDKWYPAAWHKLAAGTAPFGTLPPSSGFEPTKIGGPSSWVALSSVPPWPGYPPNMASARAVAMAWTSDPDLLAEAQQIRTARAKQGVETPSWCGFVVPFLSYPWRFPLGDVSMPDTLNAEVGFVVGIPRGDGLFEFVLKAVVVGGIAFGFAAAAGGALAAAIELPGESILAASVEGLTESAIGQTILAGEIDPGALLAGAVGGALGELAEGGALGGLLGKQTDLIVSETASGLLAGESLGDALLDSFKEHGMGFMDTFGDVGSWVKETAEDWAGAIESVGDAIDAGKDLQGTLSGPHSGGGKGKKEPSSGLSDAPVAASGQPSGGPQISGVMPPYLPPISWNPATIALVIAAGVGALFLVPRLAR